eukprot:TRINITY_DN66640_c5_g4_i1.p1 TRINITY_DN66640_c5_g4~~TRINITY_DN66640_c5_g4_i1.p1  ORF type:complete len:530 (+),score=111.64 TRINITY_DN66640_c5_g4_i1:84-1673(+)
MPPKKQEEPKTVVIDEADGHEINPHIPQYMANAPWYLNQDKPSLKHQKSSLKHLEEDKKWYARGEKIGDKPLKFRKGACTNCGAMTHKTKDCCERPRKVGAKFTEEDMCADERIVEVKLGYEGKRDRWNGYDASNHNKLLAEYEGIEKERRAIKAKQLESAVMAGKDEDLEDDEDEDLQADIVDDADDKVEKERNLVSKADPRTRTTIRNLRIREDTAKYLRNLDLNSAFYDPKSRSMRENPHENTGKNPDELLYAGDNWVRNSGDALEWTKMQVFCWDATKQEQDVHLQAAPTHAAAMQKHFQEVKAKLEERERNNIIAKYGGAEHLKPLPMELQEGQSEAYVEYSRDGKVRKGKEKTIAKSKYHEDVYLNNHSSVWGSYWEDGKWGYDCCHQFIRNSICTAAAKIKKTLSIRERQTLVNQRNVAANKKAQEEAIKRKAEEAAAAAQMEELTKAMEANAPHKKVEAAKTKKKRAGELSEAVKKKQKYNSMQADETEVTPEQLEAYRKTMMRAGDPMANFNPDEDPTAE